MSETKAHGIIMTGHSVRGILADEKTNTRRVVKPQARAYNTDILDPWVLYPCENSTDIFGDPGKPIRCPYGKPGDLLWVKENWSNLCEMDIAVYQADLNAIEHLKGIKWRSSRFMPRWASRITLRIKDIRVERVQEISEEDVFAEGVQIPVNDGTPFLRLTGDSKNPAPAQYLKKGYSNIEFIRAHFAALWDSIYAKTFPWDSSPWIWVIEFARETC